MKKSTLNNYGSDTAELLMVFTEELWFRNVYIVIGIYSQFEQIKLPTLGKLIQKPLRVVKHPIASEVPGFSPKDDDAVAFSHNRWWGSGI